MRDQHERLGALGVRLVGVAPKEAYQAERLMADGIGVELLLDPTDSIRRALGKDDRFGWRGLLHPRGAVAYARAVRQAGRFDPIWSEATVRPGILVLNAELNVVWSRMGSFIGDYPTADEVITAASTALNNSGHA